MTGIFQYFFLGCYLAWLTLGTCFNVALFSLWRSANQKCFHCADESHGTSMWKIVMIPGENICWARCGSPDEVLLCWDLCVKNIRFLNEVFFVGSFFRFLSCSSWSCVDLGCQRSNGKWSLSSCETALSCIQLKFSFCELMTILLNLAQTIST